MGEKKKERRMLTKRFFFCFTFSKTNFFFFSWIQALGLGRLPFASVPNRQTLGSLIYTVGRTASVSTIFSVNQ
jgi:hypothetical protein